MNEAEELAFLMECGPAWGRGSKHTNPLTSAAILQSLNDSRPHMKDNANA